MTDERAALRRQVHEHRAEWQRYERANRRALLAYYGWPREGARKANVGLRDSVDRRYLGRTLPE